jgi:hypothetical protein
MIRATVEREMHPSTAERATILHENWQRQERGERNESQLNAHAIDHRKVLTIIILIHNKLSSIT